MEEYNSTSDTSSDSLSESSCDVIHECSSSEREWVEDLSNWLKHRKKIQDLSHHLKTEFLQDINQFIIDFKQINVSTLHDKRIKQHIKDHIYLMDMHRHETKNSIFTYYHDDPVFNYFERDIKQHEIAVFLNTQCGFIYDIALNVSEFCKTKSAVEYQDEYGID